jgi:hypothetical protein
MIRTVFDPDTLDRISPLGQQCGFTTVAIADSFQEIIERNEM